jgi:hypothetical protein
MNGGHKFEIRVEEGILHAEGRFEDCEQVNRFIEALVSAANNALDIAEPEPPRTPKPRKKRRLVTGPAKPGSFDALVEETVRTRKTRDLERLVKILSKKPAIIAMSLSRMDARAKMNGGAGVGT